MANFNLLVDFFPVKYQSEISDILTEIESSLIASTIEQLALLNPTSLATEIELRLQDDFLNKMYNTTIFSSPVEDSAVQLTIDNYIIGDINDPETNKEQSRVDTVWNYFYELFAGPRRGVMVVIGNDFKDNLKFDITENPFFEFSKLIPDEFKAGLSSEFYLKYAEYLIGEAQRYLTVNRRTFMLTGRVINLVGNHPIHQAKVIAKTTPEIEFQGITYTNPDGYYNLYFSRLEAIEDPTLDINIEIHKAGFVNLSESLEYVRNEPNKILVSRLQSSNDSTSAEIEEVTSALNILLPEQLVEYFTDYSIVTLKDIRNIGLLRNRKDLTIENPGHRSVLNKMDSLALMELVSLDYRQNNVLINAGLESFVDVAAQPRSTFVSDMKSQFDSEFETVKYYDIAKKLSMVAANEIRVVKDGLNTDPIDPNLKNFDECGCKDCNSAVGPMAYLADLMSFSFENITDNAEAIDNGWLVANLYRNFSAIPIECGELDNNICQARIATEVLQLYYDALPQPVKDLVNGPLQARTKQYHIDAYKAILIQIGTSYEELQSFQTVSSHDLRLQYAHRLGILLADPLADPPSEIETIKELYRDVTQSTSLESDWLEEMFGLPKTIQTSTPPEPRFHKWKRLRMREIWEVRDHINTAYSRGEKIIIDPDVISVDDFRLPKEGEYIGFNIWKNRRNFIDEEVFEQFSGFNVSHQAELLEGTEGFKYTPQGESEVTINDVWQQPDSISLIKSLLSQIQTGDTEAKNELYDVFRLKADEASRLIEIHQKETDETSVTPEEKWETASICTQVVKRAFTATWLAEEVSQNIQLSAENFWISERPPIEGYWPLIRPEFLYRPIVAPETISRPLIDPQLISLAALPEHTFQVMNTFSGNSASSIYNGRVVALNDIRTNLDTYNTIPAKVNWAFTGSGYEYNSVDPLEEQTFVFLSLQLNNPLTYESSVEIIIQDLKLTIENFSYIMSLGQKYGDANALLSTTESERLNSILIAARKEFNLYLSWYNVEAPRPDWAFRKTFLPKWRATVSERKEWEKAYHEHNKAPIINADLIGPAYMVNPIVGNAAFDLWLERYNQMHSTASPTGWYETISSDDFASTQNVENFDILIEKYVMLDSGVTLLEIILRKEAKEDISKVLEQLTVSATDFKYFTDIRSSLQDDYELSPDQLSRLFYILAEIQKIRLFYQYNIQEKDDNLTQSPDFFVSRDTDYYTYPPNVPYPLNPYLVSESELSSWRRTISSRLNEERSANQSYSAMLLTIDDETITFLRDALIDACVAGNQSIPEKARAIGDLLVIDMQDNCCTKTNRVAMAIETMQQLIWKTSTGDILSDYPDLSLLTDSFDTIWEWLGSYSNWRASMFVYLYPENILLPSLKRLSTPGFRTIIENTQNNRYFNPARACEIAADYRQYLKDVSTLVLKCSAQTSVVTQKEAKCSGANQVIDNLTFVIATATNSGKSYYMTVKSTQSEHTQKTFWNRIPGIPDKAIIQGSDVYHSDKRGLHFIYVFYMIEAFGEENKFYAMRFDVNSNSWGTSPLDFEVKTGDLSVLNENGYVADPYVEDNLKILNIEICKNQLYWQPPFLTISAEIKDSLNVVRILTYSRSLGGDGVAFSDEQPWTKWIRYQLNYTIIDGQIADSKVLSVAFSFKDAPIGKPDYYGFEYFFIFENSRMRKLGRADNGDQVWTSIPYTTGKPPFDLIGVLPDIEVFQVCLDFEDGIGSSPQGYVYSSIAQASDYEPFFLNEKIEHTIPNRGAYLEEIAVPFIYQPIDKPIQFTTVTFNDVSGKLEFGDIQMQLSPQFNQTPPFNPLFSQSELGSLKVQSETNLNANTIESNPNLRIYAEEAYYYAPMQVALKLSDNGYFKESLRWFRMVYDYLAASDNRKIYYGLIQEEQFANLQDRIAEWYTDPLNPHAIASTRRNAFTKYTIMSIANTLLAYANAEFTSDNSESVPRAREMYEDIIDLVSVLEIADPCNVDETIQDLDSYLQNEPIWSFKGHELFRRLANLDTTPDVLTGLKEDIIDIIERLADPLQVKYKDIEDLINDAFNDIPEVTLGQKLDVYKYDLVSRIGVSMADGKLESIFQSGRTASGDNLVSTLTAVTGYKLDELPTANLEWLYTDDAADQSTSFKTNPVAISPVRDIHNYAGQKPQDGFNIANPFPEIRLSGMSYLFCVTPNPMVTGALMAAYANLYKIHNCMNIAGMVRELNPFAAPTDAITGIPTIGVGGTLQLPGQALVAPTNFRYAFLVDRARQLVSFAQQMESTLLQSLERLDIESYAILKAEQDLTMAKANITLQDLKIKEAESNKVLAQLQKDRAQIQVDGLQGMIDEGLLSYEDNLLQNYTELLNAEISLNALLRVESQLRTTLQALTAGGGVTAGASILAAMAVAQGISLYYGAIQNSQDSAARSRYNISYNSLYASFQRREQEWNYQKSIATQDVKIGGQQIRIADDRIRIVGQERAMADIQQEHAQATLDFLNTKFTNVELYEWMSGVLEDVYAHFLQEATAMSKLAEQQLSFERQVNLPGLIKSDYWNVASNNALSLIGNSSTDRKGLTGSARLLKDLSELEQYAMDTNERKLQMTKIISLNEHDPVQMEMFRNSGILRFTTTQRDFDWDYPGHYLRLIRRVSVTVIALTPPNKGIKGTLIHSGISTVVTSTNNTFQNQIIARTPERIALSSPYNESGLFQLESQDELYRPFEGSGVEGLWELRMEKASNPFDYRSIADVLVTVEYDALHNEQYSQIIKTQLNNEDRPESLVFSVRNDLPDQWYDLMNATEDGLITHFDIRNNDLAPNVLSNSLTEVKVFMSFDLQKMEENNASEVDGIDGSIWLSKNEPGEAAGAEIPLNQFLLNGVRTFEGFPNIEDEVQGRWYIRFTETTQVLNMIEKGYLQDILIILNYRADKVAFNL